MTEADIETRISAALRVVFPALDDGRITHQKSFSVRLGHTVHKVDGTKTDLLRGRLDILIELDGVPLAILEVKGCGERLDRKVTQQGLSYARAMNTDSIPPLVITTNGKECRFFRSWDGSEWQAETQDDHAFQTLFSEATEASGEDIDKAVQHLLNIVPSAWPEAIRSYTKSEIKLISGDLEDLSRPVASDFNIPRKVTVEIANSLHLGTQKIALMGDPFSGKTNVFANLTEHPGTENFCFLYVNLAASSEGIFDRIAAVFSEVFFRTIEKSLIQTWIINQLPRISETAHLVILIDGLDSTDYTQFKRDLDTVARYANEKRLSLVVSAHEELILSLAKVRGTGVNSTLGMNMKGFNLNALDNLEWRRAENVLRDARQATFQSCADLVFELRQPRLLRLLASTIKSSKFESRSKDEISVIWSVCRPKWFINVWENFSDTQVREGYAQLAEALLNHDSIKQIGEEYALMLKFGTLDIRTTEAFLDPSNRQWLKDRGFLQLIHRTNGERHYISKVPELLMTAVAQIIARNTRNIFNQRGKEDARDYLVESSDPLPYCGIVCAMALIFLAESKPNMFLELVDSLLDSEPVHVCLGAGTELISQSAPGMFEKFVVSSPDIGGSVGPTAIVNQTPWLAVSYLASLSAEEHVPSTLRNKIIERIGSHSFPMTGIEISHQYSDVALTMRDLPDGITILYGHSALLEPVVMGISRGFLDLDSDLFGLCRKAIAARNIPLIWRLRTAARSLFDCSENGVDSRMRPLVAELDSLLQSCPGTGIGQQSIPPEKNA